MHDTLLLGGCPECCRALSLVLAHEYWENDTVHEKPSLRHMASTRHFALLTTILLLASWNGVPAEEIRVADYGTRGDGIADDSAAIGKALAALAAAPRPAVLRFGGGRAYRVASGEGYVINLERQDRITIEGEGAVLLLNGDRRGIALNECRNITVRGLRIDYDPLPFAEALVTAVDRPARYIDVRISEGFSVPPLGGPTRSGGEQAYFAMLWNPGLHALRSTHYMLADVAAVPGDARQLRATAEQSFRDFAAIRPGITRITVPVRGIAHRHGAGAVLHLDGNRDVLCEDVEIWSAPWFACVVQRNEGPVTLRRVHVRPKPGTARITSSWRDGIHVKGNRGRLLFEECVLDGMNDDAFNIATFLSQVEAVDGARLSVRQNFPLCFVGWRVGDTLGAYSARKGVLLDRAKIVAVEEQASLTPDRARVVTLTLAEPLPGVARGDQVWAVEAANPDTMVRRCTIRNSCRFQSPVTLEECSVTAFLWFYGEHVEGPVPGGSVVRRCKLQLGRGNREMAVSCDGWLHGLPQPAEMTGPPPLQGLRFDDNEIDGRFEISQSQRVHLVNNRFTAERGRLTIRNCRDVLIEGTRLGDEPFPKERLQMEGKGTRESLTVK